MPLAWQIIVRYRDDRVLTPLLSCTRRLAASVGRSARPFPLLAFGVADSHAHLAVVTDREAAGELARRVLIGLHQVLGRRAPLERARLVAVHDQRHLRHLFWYVLGQAEHHGIAADPLREGTSLPDLLGLRLNAGWTAAHVRAHLPRVTRTQLEERLGISAADAGPLRADCLLESACSALGVGGLSPRTEVGRVGLGAAVQVGDEAAGASELAAALGISRGFVWRLRREPVPAALVAAVQGQWTLRSALAERPEGAHSPPAPGPGASCGSARRSFRYWLHGTEVGYQPRLR
ncbi:MAG: hypothetical protein H6742_08635 [Alphaproteobacteria bacterium]|nr:hypothetical protein [Alphaproteobacteria bacterium]